jgi:CubicO group peptidase (beta-lactamase class C family)
MDQPARGTGARGGARRSRRALLQQSVATAAFALVAGGTSSVGAASSLEPASHALETTVAQRADRLLSEFVARRVFRGAALIARKGSVLLSKGYDWADVASRVPNTPSTRFRIASVTKQFTAMAILQAACMFTTTCVRIHPPALVTGSRSRYTTC